MKLSTLLDLARGEIGYHESPAGSNVTKYAINPIEYGVSWCGVFVNWCFAGTGMLPGSMFWTPAGAAAFKAGNRWSTASAPGSIVFMTFRADRQVSHIGIVESGYTHIEGNTSSDMAGSQDNGGGVYRRTRHAANIIGYGRMFYEPEDDDEVTKLVRKTSTGEICMWDNGRITSVVSMYVLSKLQAAGLVEATWTEMDDATFDALPHAV